MSFVLFIKVFEVLEKRDKKMALKKAVFYRGPFQGPLWARIPALPCISLHRLMRRKKQKTLDVF
tara:strand:- start:81 stop:272 length:192 start_codon:yes stop_codon:yes gene_type:complete